MGDNLMNTIERMEVLAQKTEPQNTLSFSNIGNEDERYLWLDFRWCLPVKEATKQRQDSFRMGEQIELNIIGDLKKANLTVYDIDTSTGRQYAYSYHGGHFVGKIDCVISDLPETGEPTAIEIKSAKQTEFNKFKKHGVKEWVLKYFTQANCAAGAAQVQHAAVIVESKNDQARHIEILPFDNFHWQSTQAKAARIIQGRALPPSPYKEDDQRVQNFLTDEQRRIYLKKALPSPNCRNCHYAQPVIDDSVDAKWGCSKHKKFLTLHDQKVGCNNHVFLPELMPDLISVIGVEKYGVVYEFVNGTTFINGDKTEEETFTSKDLHSITKTHELSQETLFTTEMAKLKNIINVNNGLEAKEISCAECRHFERDTIGSGQGVGNCLQEAENGARFPDQKHNCIIFQYKE